MYYREYLEWRIYHFGQHHKSVKVPNWEICASARRRGEMREKVDKADVSGRGSPLLLHLHPLCGPFYEIEDEPWFCTA